MLFVGRVESPKGVGRLLEVVRRLADRGIEAQADVVGDGPERDAFERRAAELGVADRVRFWGWRPRQDLVRFYEEAHFMVMPTSSSEGWPKVLSEAMAYGAVPIAGAVSSIPQTLEELGSGAAVDPEDVDGFVRTIEGYTGDPARWSEESVRGSEAASAFTYRHYLGAVRTMFRDRFGVELAAVAPDPGKRVAKPRDC
jgi:glycosyltransferase involved in cell wall biosynthesis